MTTDSTLENTGLGEPAFDRDDSLSANVRLHSDVDAIELFFEQVDDVTQRYGTASRRLRQVCSSVLSNENISEIVLSSNDEDAEPTNRDQVRHFKKAVNEATRNLKPAIVYARAAAQAYVWGETSEEDGGEDYETDRDKIKEVYAQYYSKAKDEDAIPMARYGGAAWVDVFETQKDVCESEKQLHGDLRFFLGLEANNVVDLLSHMRDEKFNRDEYLPLLRFMANNLFDPLSDNIIKKHLGELMEKPELYKPVFCDFIDQCFDEDEATREFAIEGVGAENIVWLEFLRSQNDQVELSIGNSFKGIPLEQWPQPLRDRLVVAHQEFLGAVRNGYSEFLTPFVDSKSFYVANNELNVMFDNGSARMNGHTDAPQKKNKRRQNSRTSIKGRPDAFLPEVEEADVYHATIIEEWVLGPRGYNVARTHEIDEEAQPLKDMILDLAPVKKYLKGRSDPDIEQDMINMFESLLKEPYGNGATKMNGWEVSLSISARDNTSFPVWHLNPNKRSNLSIGNTGRDTRIYYVPYRNAEGTSGLALLSVGHKNDLAKKHSGIGGN